MKENTPIIYNLKKQTQQLFIIPEKKYTKYLQSVRENPPAVYDL